MRDWFAAAGLAALVTIAAACSRPVPAKIDLHANFFPLKTDMTWTYRIDSKSQHTSYVITDRVVGSQYVPALKLTGLVVAEFYNLDRAGLRPIVYVDDSGYLTRLSGLDYDKHRIITPAWGKSEEDDFLPAHLAPNLAWNNELFPYGKLPGGFEIVQSHKSFGEPADVAVPAGHFTGCIRIETRARYQGGAYAESKQQLKLTYEDWYAPNVGLIKTIAFQGGPDGPEMERVELMRFDVASKGDQFTQAQGIRPAANRPQASAGASAPKAQKRAIAG
ncbi:hypothetical protein IMX07_00515 [bacterium]|nr:hypothetical protein [bacterium]